jgi:dihydroorotate dehydrogenase
MIYPLARAALFRLEPERAHQTALTALAAAAATPPGRAWLRSQYGPRRATPVRVLGLEFPNPVGLAAGYDKNGHGWRGLGLLGFGHVEVGTVTPLPQPGNARPRVFRLTGAESLINRMGFPGDGAEAVSGRLRGERRGLILGVNIGKQKSTPIEEAVHDYTELMDVFAPLADYLAVNISSPNTPGLRDLQEGRVLTALLRGIADRKGELEERLERRVPVVVKIAPDLDRDPIREAVDAVVGAGLDGVVATNTTIGRPGVADHPHADEAGGLSGAALSERSTEVVRIVCDHLDGTLPVIGVGGIMGPDDARAKVEAGASLIQVYTGLIYRGPQVVRQIVEALADDGATS